MNIEQDTSLKQISQIISNQLNQANYVDISKSQPQKLQSEDLKYIFTIDVSLDGEFIAAAGQSPQENENSSIIVFQNFTQIKCLKSQIKYIYCVQFSQDQQKLAVGGYNPFIVELWFMNNAEPVRIFEGHEGSIFRIKFVQNSNEFCTCSHDLKTILWKDQDKIIMEGHTSYVYDCAISNNKKQIATVGFDQQLIVYDYETGQIIKQLICSDQYVSSVIYNNNDSIIITAGFDGKIKLWDAIQFILIKEIQAHKPLSYIWSIAISNDNNIIASTGCDNTIRLRNLIDENEQIVYEAKMFGAPGAEICIKCFNKVFVSTNYNQILIWNK